MSKDPVCPCLADIKYEVEILEGFPSYNTFHRVLSKREQKAMVDEVLNNVTERMIKKIDSCVCPLEQVKQKLEEADFHTRKADLKNDKLLLGLPSEKGEHIAEIILLEDFKRLRSDILGVIEGKKDA